MGRRGMLTAVAAGAVGLFSVFVLSAPAGAAGITVYKDGDRYVEVGGQLQLQYHWEDADGAESTDSVFFRRLRPYIEGSIHKDWMGKFQWDMGKAEDDDEFAVKEAYIKYKGIEKTPITLGNRDFPFSREKLTSSKKQQLVERTFVGDHNYGTPDKQPGLYIDGEFSDGYITYGAGVASASIDPDSSKLDFDTPINRDSDFNEGWMAGGRVDYHPFGRLAFDQGDFDRGGLRATVGVGFFVWGNDSDNDTYTNAAGSDTSAGARPDVDSVTGIELSGGVRYMGASVDAQFNFFDAETVDPTVTAGIYRNGSTELTNFSIEGGYMVLADRLELVAGIELQDADNYSKNWTRASLGANYFLKKHDIKAQLTYRVSDNVDGVDGREEDEVFIQAQYVF